MSRHPDREVLLAQYAARHIGASTESDGQITVYKIDGVNDGEIVVQLEGLEVYGELLYLRRLAAEQAERLVALRAGLEPYANRGSWSQQRDEYGQPFAIWDWYGEDLADSKPWAAAEQALAEDNAALADLQKLLTGD